MRHPGRVLAALAGACLLFHFLLFAGAAVDDAYISYEYARNLLHGRGLVYRAGAPPVEGYSNFLWTVLHVPAAALTDPIVYSKILGVLLLGLNLWLVFRVTRRFAPGANAAPALAVLWLAASPGFVYWHLAGLEPPLVAASLLAACFAPLLVSGRRARAVEAAACIALSLVRIDSVLLAVAVLGVRLLLTRRAPGGAWRDTARIAALVAAAYAVYTVWRVVYFGGLLPNTAHAKVMSLGEALGPGARYTASLVLRQPWLLLLPVAAWHHRRDPGPLRAPALAAVAACLVQGVIVIAAGGDWMPLHRFLMPLLPLGAVLAAAWAHERRGLAAPLAAVALVAGPLAWPLGNTAFEVRLHTENTATARALGRALAAEAEPGQTTAIGAAGAAPYFSGLPNWDTGGLNDAHIARRAPPAPIPGLPPGHQRGDGAYVLAQRPDWLVFVLGRSEVPGQELTDAAIAFDPAFYAHYEPVTLRAARPAHRVWLPRATRLQARQLNDLAALRPVPAAWGTAFAAGPELEFVVYRRIAGTARDPVRGLFAALDAAQSAHDMAGALRLLEQGTAVLDGSGLVQIRRALEARYALALGDRPRAAAALAAAAAAPGRLGPQLQLWVLQDPALRTLVNTASAS